MFGFVIYVAAANFLKRYNLYFIKVSTVYSDIDPGYFAITFKKTSSYSVVTSIPEDIYDSLKYYAVII